MIRRKAGDRRGYKAKTRFPFRDSEDEWIMKNRRTQPDRRLGYVEAEWLEMVRESGHSSARRRER